MSKKAVPFLTLTLCLGLSFGLKPVTAASKPTTQLTAKEEEGSNYFLEQVDAYFGQRAMSSGNVSRLGDDVIITPTPSNGDPYPPDPIDVPTNYDDPNYSFPIFQAKNGASERIALEVLYQTLSFYGVAHVIEKTGTRVDFKVLRSKNGYFNSLTKLDIAYAIREFGRYLTAMLCNNANMQNFYSAFVQVPPEEIGLRFKYDMAWALLGNSLPKEPNAIFALGTKWSALNQILQTTNVLRPGGGSPYPDPNAPIDPTGGANPVDRFKDLRSWASIMSDAVNVTTRLNKLNCYVDIRPVPQDEIKKRVVISKFLEMEKRLKERYDVYRDILTQMEKEGKSAQISSLRESAGAR